MRIPARVGTSTKPYATLTARDLLDGIKSGSAHDAFNLARRVERVLALHRQEVGGPECYICPEDYPCATVRALDGEDA